LNFPFGFIPKLRSPFAAADEIPPFFFAQPFNFPAGLTASFVFILLFFPLPCPLS
jgi:hypothetical protein